MASCLPGMNTVGAVLRLSADAGRQTKKENIQFRPLCDGVFRAVPPTVNAKEFCGKILQQVQ